MPGPPKQSKAIKELKGTYDPSKEVANSMEGAVISSLPTAPDDLPEPGRAAWYRVVTELQSLGILTVLDYDLLKTYCYQIAVMDEASKEMEKASGKVEKLKSANGGSYYVKSPWVGIYNDAAAQAFRIGQTMGLSPASRTKISLNQARKEKEVDPWDDL